MSENSPDPMTGENGAERLETHTAEHDLRLLARAYEAEERARFAAELAADRARRLQLVASALSEAATRADVARVVTEHGLRAVGADAGSLAVLDAEGRTFTMAGAAGYPEDQQRRFGSFPVDGRAPMSRAVLEGRIVAVPTLEDARRDYPEFAGELGYGGFQAFVAVAILSRERPIGAIGLSFRQPRAFAEDDRRFLETLSSLCAHALDRAKLYEDAERARARASFLSTAATELASSLEFEVTLERVAALAVPTLADWCIVDVVDDSGETKLLALAHADPHKAASARALRRARERPEPGVLQIIRTGVPSYVPVISPERLEAGDYDPEYARQLRAFGFRSYMGVPMRARGRTLGVISFVTTDESGRVYSAEDFALAQELAARAAVAVDNARLHRESEAARREAEAANRAKSQFLATMSHELRTPLNAIIGYQALLAEGITGPVNDQQRVQLGRIRGSAMHLLGVIEEILSFSRLEAGRETIALERLDACECVRDVADIVAPLARERGLALDVRAPDGRVELETDAGKLRQILLNLAGNAVKFTERGSVTLRVAVAGEAVRFDVEDTGIGVAPEDRERIWQPFRQVEPLHTRTRGGTGLGLSVTRRLAVMLGGQVTLESAPGRGSTFTVLLPRTPSAAGD